MFAAFRPALTVNCAGTIKHPRQTTNTNAFLPCVLLDACSKATPWQQKRWVPHSVDCELLLSACKEYRLRVSTRCLPDLTALLIHLVYRHHTASSFSPNTQIPADSHEGRQERSFLASAHNGGCRMIRSVLTQDRPGVHSSCFADV